MGLINPVAVVVQHLKVNDSVHLGVSGRIAGKDRYGLDTSADGWAQGSTSIVLRLDDSELSNEVPVHKIRLEVRIYGADQDEIVSLWVKFIVFARDVWRAVVALSGGNALLHSLTQASGVSLLWDERLKMDYALQFFEAIIGESSL